MGSIKYPKKSAGGRLGKIDAPLGKKLQAVKWGEYRLGELFEIENTQSFNTDRLVSGNEYDYVTRTSLNQGVLQSTGFVNEENINPAGTWSLGLLQMDFFYRNKPWYAGQFVRRIVPKISIPECAILFFQTLLNRQKPILLQVLVRNVDKTFRNIAVHLPTTADNKIDFDFMESFVRELEEERVRELEEERVRELAAYLTASGLADTTLTASEQAALNAFDTLEWGAFRIGDLFEKIKVKSLKYKTNDLPSVANKEFDLPALTAGIQNQGLNNYVPRENATILKNVISISANGANTGATFYQSKDFTVLQDSYAIKWIYSDVDLTGTKYLFLVGAISKRIYGNYEWTNKAGWERIKTNTISLPQTVDNQIDYAIMQDLISAVQKLVIKDVVAYADRKIAATKTVVGKT